MDLNAEQKKIAFQRPKGHGLLRGVAGSGKTTVGIYRIPFLLHNYCFNKDDSILLVTFNKTLINYMGYLYKKIESKDFSEFNSLFSTPDRKVDIKTVDSLMFQYYLSYAKEQNHKFQVGLDQAQSYEIIKEGISKLKKHYPEVNILDQNNTVFLHGEIRWIKDCLYLEEEEYQNADRLGQTKAQTDGSPQRLLKNSQARKAIYELMLYYDKRIRAVGYITFSDMRVLALEKAKKFPGHKYAHIIVDESQDLTRSQLLFLKQLYNDKDGSSIIFIADTAQSIYPQSWLGSGRSFASIGFNMIGRGHLLSKNFRTTTQISQAAYSLIENCTEIVDDENFVKPYLIDKQGPYPVCKTFSNDATQAEYVAEEVSKYLLSNQPKDIAIVARFKNQLVYIQKYLGKKGIKSSFISKKEADFESASINLLTMHSIKGLEFRVVILIGLNDGVMPYYSSRDPGTRAEESIKERRLLYVGMTRATETLFLLSSASKPSKFLMDINSQFIKIDQQSQMRRFYNISIEDYRFKNKLQDIHATEEKIRQWVIAELIDSYKYPQDTISIEFPVNSFSRKGFVDIAIEINKDGQRTPFIFIETKRQGQGIESALNQLKSYMSNCKQCQYGVVTDGNDIKIVDNEFKPIADIPRFRHSWHSSSMRRYAYINLKTKINYSLAIDDNDPTILEVYSNDLSDAIEAKHFNRLPVYGKIAAGTPLHMNVELDDRYYFPKEWHKGSKFFILKVQGDSMKNAGINDDDYVVVRQQNNAENLDIVVVALSECATLKRFSKMGDNALLLSENPKYDPILLNEDQVSILGVAVGLVKQIN